MSFRSFVTKKFKISEKFDHFESERIWILFKQRQSIFGYKKKQERAYFWLASINKRKVDFCVKSSWCKKTWKLVDKLHWLAANCTIYSFNPVSYTNMSIISLQSCFLFKRGMFSTYTLFVIFFYAHIVFVTPLAAGEYLGLFVKSHARN